MNKKIVGIDLKTAIEVLKYNGPVFEKKRRKLNTPDSFMKAIRGGF